MSRLSDLINDLYPADVPSVSLGSLMTRIRERGKDDESVAQVYVVSNTQGMVRAEDYRENTIHSEDTSNYTVIRPGMIAYNPSRLNIGSIAMLKNDEPGLVSPMYVVFSIDQSKVEKEYFELLLKSPYVSSRIEALKEEGARFRFDYMRWDWINVPLPSKTIQHEVVNTLNVFQYLINSLTSELDARKKQYEHYRKTLLAKCDKYKSLKEISVNSCSGATPKKNVSEYYQDGKIPWLRTQEVVYNEIFKTECFITELAVKKTSAKWIPANCVIVAISGASAGRCAINKIPLTTNQHCLNIEIDPEQALYRYVFYCVCNQGEELLDKKEGARGDLNASRILSLKIPVPPLEEQERIVSILDHFDTLCNNIFKGLPAEIDSRKKQYEYYRDKLLTFEEHS